jgi:hypothetical protein
MIAVAWLERPTMRKRWCRAKHKRTTIYADSVRTLCGNTIALPCGLSQEADVDCEDCLAAERRKKKDGRSD